LCAIQPSIVDGALGVERGKLVEQCACFGLMRRGARERRRIAFEAGGEAWRNFVPKKIAAVRGVAVAFILDPAEAAGPRVGRHRFARLRQQGSQQGRSAAPKCRHRGQSSRTGAAQQLQQYGFGLVVGVVCERDHVHVA